MSIHIRMVWHRVWGLGRAISGVCKREEDGTFYWFEWNEPKKIYHAYILEESQHQEAEEFGKQVAAVLGNIIYHDDRFGFTETEEDFGIIPDMPFKLRDELTFTFSPGEVINPIPGILTD